MLEANGDVISANDLGIVKARELACYLSSNINPYAELFEVRRDASTRNETIVLEVRVAVSQLSKYPILPIERIAVTFFFDDRCQPEVVSLREDFPIVLHLNLRDEELPRSLCLYDVSYDALKLRWTAPGFVERVREWLSLTSAGELHQDDQPLEPLLLGGFPPLIIDPSSYTALASAEGLAKQFFVTALGTSDQGPTAYRLEPAEKNSNTDTHRVVAMIAAPREHGILRQAPHTLKDLLDLCEREGLPLRRRLRESLPDWKDDKQSGTRQLVLMILFPKVREQGDEAKDWDTLAFFLLSTVENIGVALGVWERGPSGELGLLIGASEERGTEGIRVAILNPVLSLTKVAAAAFNGTQAIDDSFVMVGVGALGSMLLANLVRKGFGRWTLLDKDMFYPHNGARHLLPGNAAGFPKVQAVQAVVESFYADQVILGAHVADVLHATKYDGSFDACFQAARAIVDCSADIPVARHLALQVQSDARRVSVFLNPNAEDLVILAEDARREFKLDVLEMQYYSILLNTHELSKHLEGSIARLRYGRSCRDLSAVISADAVTRNAAIASSALPKILTKDAPAVKVWAGLPDGSVFHFEGTLVPSYEAEVNGTRVVWDQNTLNQLRELRRSRLPKETGGALIGHWDHSRRTLYILAATKAPKDSNEELTGFVRGADPELQRSLESAAEVTGGAAQYVGEWHSHPDGFSTEPSKLDRKLFDWIEAQLAVDGLPPVMLIVGSEDLRFVTGREGSGTAWKYSDSGSDESGKNSA